MLMSGSFRRYILPLWVAAIVLALTMAVRADDAATQPSAKIRVVLAGDSTTAVGSGWGPGFKKSFDDQIEIINMARGGRSSKSYIAEGLWKKCLALKPDYVLIQFGHNDQPGHGTTRETDPDTTYRQFMTQYVEDARAAGIKPILITPLSRRQWGADGTIHSTLEPNARVVREIAAEKHVPLIDLHAISIELYNRLGKEGCDELSPLKKAGAKGSKTPANSDYPQPEAEAPVTQPSAGMAFDGTHLNAKGSAGMAFT